MAVVFNSLFMAMVVFIFHLAHRKMQTPLIYILLPALWITWEWLHLDWDLSWPWLMMGNGFASNAPWVQWYEYTGTLGGTLWILTSNILFFLLWKNYSVRKVMSKRILISWLAVIIVPAVISLIIYYTYSEKPNPVNVVIVQPNIDPYNEKFGGMPEKQQVLRMITLASQHVDEKTDYLIGPETSIPNPVWEEGLSINRQVEFLKSYVSQFPRLTMVTGASTNRFYSKESPRSATARKFSDSDDYYDSFNTAMQIDNTDSIQLYHKSKLVPGVEKMPFPAVFKHIEKFAIDLGGASGSLGVQEAPSVFINNKHLAVAPIICYESIYGAYISEYVRKGASLLFIITNDGWWGDTPGYRQHLQYARLRAVEMRRSIARSANTGISAVINQRGDIIKKTGWWEPAAIKATINSNNHNSFYALHGDYLAVISAALSILILVAVILGLKHKG